MGFIKEFKEFAMRGNVMDMAKNGNRCSNRRRVYSDCKLSGRRFDNSSDRPYNRRYGLFRSYNKAYWGKSVNYGSFITAVINFIIIAFAMFLIVKAMNKLSNLRKTEPEPEALPRILVL